MTLESKYNFSVNPYTLQRYIQRLTNQLWKLIPMRENNEDWKGQLSSVLLELAGFNEIFGLNEDFLVLLAKLEGLLAQETKFWLYRKTIFESISILRGLQDEG